MGMFSFVGDFLGDIFGTTEAANKDYDVSYKSAQDQMAFQERMSNTSYQRAVKDLQKAGLNPILAATNGGASVPTGATYSSNYSGAQQSAINTASSLAMGIANYQGVKAQANNASSGAALNRASIPKVQAETNSATSQAKKEQIDLKYQDEIRRSQLERSKAEASYWKSKAEKEANQIPESSVWGNIYDKVGNIIDGVDSFVNGGRLGHSPNSARSQNVTKEFRKVFGTDSFSDWWRGVTQNW